jgi:RHS repeat-associated protein
MVRGGVTYRLLTDPLGSVRLVVDTATGTIAQRLDYDEFGQIAQDTNPGFQPFGFAGGLYDPDTKLVRFGARDYDAFTGRWTAKDPIGFVAGDSNLYMYSLDSPVDSIDPYGLWRETNLGGNWTALVDPYRGAGGAASHEIHVIDPAGREVGVLGPNGWISKHGITEPPDLPQGVWNRLNGMNVDLLRRQGKLLPKGRQNIKGGRYMKGLGCLGSVLGVLDLIDILQRAESSGKSPTQQYLEDLLGTPFGPSPI